MVTAHRRNGRSRTAWPLHVPARREPIPAGKWAVVAAAVLAVVVWTVIVALL